MNPKIILKRCCEKILQDASIITLYNTKESLSQCSMWLIDRGEVNFSQLGKKAYKGDIIIAPDNYKLHNSLDENCQFEALEILCNAGSVQMSILSNGKRQYINNYAIHALQDWKSLATLTHELSLIPQEYVQMQRALLYYILQKAESLIVERKTASDKQTQVAQRIHTVLAYISKNYNTKMYLNDLAEMLNMSPAGTNKFLNNYLGGSFIWIVNFFRVLYGREYILNGDSVKEATQKVGFGGEDQFIKFFKRFFKEAPYRYKQRLALALEQNEDLCPFFDIDGFGHNQMLPWSDLPTSELQYSPKLHIFCNISKEERHIYFMDDESNTLIKGMTLNASYLRPITLSQGMIIQVRDDKENILGGFVIEGNKQLWLIAN